MAADGTINIDLVLNSLGDFKSDLNQAETIINQVGDNAGDTMEQKFSENTDKVVKDAEETANRVKDKLDKIPKEKVTKLKAQSEKAGIHNFEALVDALPKERLTELIAKAEKGEAINFEQVISEIPKEKRTQLDIDNNTSKPLKEAGDDADQTGGKFSRLKDIIGGTFISGMAISAVQAAGSAVKGLASEAVGASDSMDKFKSTMKLGGFGEDEINTAAKAVRKYADDTVYDLGDVSNTTAQLAANGIKNYTELTQAAGNLNAQAGGNADTFKSVAMVMTQTAGAGKLTTENWNQLADAIPGASGVLQEALKKNGAYTGNFRDAMSDGQITADEFNKAVTQLGMNKGAVEAAKSTSTFEGAIGNLQATAVGAIQDIIDSFGKSNLTGMINGATGAISKVVGSIQKNKGLISDSFKATYDVASSVLGSIGDIFSSFNGSFKANVAGVQTGDLDKKIKSIGTWFKSLRDAIKPVTGAVGGLIGVLTGGVWTTAVKLVQGLASAFTDSGNKADKSKDKFDVSKSFSWISTVSQDFNILIGKIEGVAKPLGEIAGTIAKGAFETFGDILGVIADAFNQVSRKAQDSVKPTNQIADALSDLAKHKDAIKAVGAAVAGLVTALTIKKGVTTVIDIAKSVPKVITSVSTSISGAAKLLAANPFMAVILGIAALGTAFYELYKHNKKFHKFVDDLADKAKGLAKGVGEWFGDVVKQAKDLWRGITDLFTGQADWEKNISKQFNKIKDAIVDGLGAAVDWIGKNWKGLALLIASPIAGGLKLLYDNNKGFREWVDDLWDKIKSGFSSMVKKIGGVWDDITDALSKGAKIAVKAITGVFKGIGKALLYAMMIPVGLVAMIVKPIIKPLQNAFKEVVSTVKKVWNSLTGWLGKSFDAVSKMWRKVWNAISDWFGDFFNGLKRDVTKWFKPIAKFFTDWFDDVHDTWVDTWDAISEWFSKFWKKFTGTIQNYVNKVKKIIGDTLDLISDKWHDVWNAISSWFNNLWSTIHGHARNGINKTKKVISDVLDAISDLWHRIWNSISSWFSNKWDTIKGLSSKAIHSVKNTLSDVLDSISTKWHKIWNGLSSFFGDIWKDIKGYAADGINGVISVINAGVNAINKVWKFFTGKNTGIKKLSPVKFAQGGIVKRHLSMVNDSPTENWKELIETPDGNLMMAQDRNAILPLEPGTRVYNGDETKQIMSMAGVEHYKDGGIVGGVKDKLSDIGSWLGEKTEAITKFIEHPIKSITSVFEKSVSGMYSGLGNFGELAKGVISKMTSPIGSWFKKGLEKVQEESDDYNGKGSSSSAKGTMSRSAFNKVAKKAADLMGQKLSSADLAHLYWQAYTESSVNPAQNGGYDDHDGTGLPIGLFQYKRGTWASWAVKNHQNIHSALDQIMAVLNDSNWRSDFPPTGVTRGWGPGGHRMMADGGILDSPALIGEVPGEPEIVVNPARNSADKLLIEAMNARIKADPNGKIAKMAANLSHISDPIQTNFSITTSGRNTQSFSDPNNSSAYSTTNKSYVLNDSKVIELLQIIANKRTTVDGSSFASAYEQYGSTETARRNQLKGRGLAIDAKI